MKLRCINNAIVKLRIDDEIVTCSGHGLVEGRIYHSKGDAFMKDGMLVYDIVGMGTKLKQRFIPTEDGDVIEDINEFDNGQEVTEKERELVS